MRGFLGSSRVWNSCKLLSRRYRLVCGVASFADADVATATPSNATKGETTEIQSTQGLTGNLIAGRRRHRLHVCRHGDGPLGLTGVSPQLIR